MAQGIADAFNQAVQELVDLNFNNVTKYPKLADTGISRVDAAAIATTYQTFTATGGLIAGSKDEQFFREQLGLPERDPDDIVTPPTPDTDPDDDPDEEVEKKKKRGHGTDIRGSKKFKFS